MRTNGALLTALVRPAASLRPARSVTDHRVSVVIRTKELFLSCTFFYARDNELKTWIKIKIILTERKDYLEKLQRCMNIINPFLFDILGGGGKRGILKNFKENFLEKILENPYMHNYLVFIVSMLLKNQWNLLTNKHYYDESIMNLEKYQADEKLVLIKTRINTLL